MKKTIKLSAILGLISLGCLPDIFADTKTWTGTSGAAQPTPLYILTTAGNWLNGVAPASGDDLIFDPANVANGVIGNSSGYLYLTSSSTTMTTYHSMSFSNTNDVTIAATSSSSSPPARTLNLTGTGAGITVSGTGDVTFGRSFGGALSVNITDVTTMNVTNADTVLAFNNYAPFIGTGSILKTGAGVLALGGASTFTGGVTLQEGTLRATASGSTSSGVLVSSPFGTGTVTLTEGTAFQGDLITSGNRPTIAVVNNMTLGGNITFGAESGTGSNALNFTTGATSLVSDTTFNVLSNVTWGQAITGANSTAYRITKSGSGTLKLSGSNGYIAGFTATGGVLEFGGTSTMGGTVGSSVPDYVADFFTMDGGTIRFTSSVLSTPLTGNRGFMLGANGGTIDVNSGVTMRANGRIRESVAGASLTKTGAGTFIMASGTSNYTGTTTVSAGSLLIESDATLSSSNVTVASGATFGGLGTVGGSVTVNGTLSPGFTANLESNNVGAQVGVLTISNSLTMSAGSILDLGISASGYDSIAGVTDLSLGGVIKVSFLDGYVPFGGNVYKIIDWSGLVVDNGYSFDFSGAQLSAGQYWDTSSFLTNGTITAVPEPSAVTLLLFSVGAVLVLRRVRLAKALKA